MAFNAFTTVRISDDGRTLLVSGFTGADVDAVTAIEVVVHAPGEPDKRLTAHIGDLGEMWHATLANGVDGQRPFALGNQIVVIGIAEHDVPAHPSPFIWGGQFDVQSGATSVADAAKLARVAA